MDASVNRLECIPNGVFVQKLLAYTTTAKITAMPYRPCAHTTGQCFKL